jgi:hypothetical protein
MIAISVRQYPTTSWDGQAERALGAGGSGGSGGVSLAARRD